GCAAVARAVSRILRGAPAAGVRLTPVFVRDAARRRVDWVPGDVVWTSNVEDVFASDANVIVEVVGGRRPGGTGGGRGGGATRGRRGCAARARRGPIGGHREQAAHRARWAGAPQARRRAAAT